MTDPAVVQPVSAVLRRVQQSVLGRWRSTPDERYREIVGLVEA